MLLRNAIFYLLPGASFFRLGKHRTGLSRLVLLSFTLRIILSFSSAFSRRISDLLLKYCRVRYSSSIPEFLTFLVNFLTRYSESPLGEFRTSITPFIASFLSFLLYNCLAFLAYIVSDLSPILNAGERCDINPWILIIGPFTQGLSARKQRIIRKFVALVVCWCICA